MKKLLFALAFLLPAAFLIAQPTVPVPITRAMSVWARNIANANATQAYTDATTNYTTGTTQDDSLAVHLDSLQAIRVSANTNAAAVALRATIQAPSFTGGISLTATVTEYDTIVVIDSTKIVGTAAGDIAHADGAILVGQPGTGFTLEFVSAFIIYDHATADFGGGNNDAVVQTGVTGTQVSVSSAITDASLLTASADKILRLGSIATELAHADNGAISLKSTLVYTNPGTAAGLLRIHLKYRMHATGL